jgi:multicomponent Na+:H+ antiporter subunit B
MNGDPDDQGMGEIVRTVARWLKGFILAYGIYLILYGHVTPGGGFAGGVVIACGFILLTLAGGQALGLSHFSRRAASSFDSAGVLLFLALACTGMGWAGGAFFFNFVDTPEEARFTLLSGGIMPVSNIGLGLKVASSLFLAFTVLAAFRIVPDLGKRREEDS